jgi:kynurenine formamidase
MKYIDLSHKIDNGIPVYPGDGGVSLVQVKHLAEDHYNAYILTTGLHAGTHIDCPMHLLENLAVMADYPLESFAGRGCLLDARGGKDIDYMEEYAGIIQKGDIVLILTGMDAFYGSERYYSGHPVVTERLAHFLASREIKMLGMDMPSPDHPPFPVHKNLLGKGIFILENLTALENLLDIKDFEVFAAPLKICAEASLTRAFARCL